RLLDIAFRLLERALAVHDAGAGALAQLFDQVEGYVSHSQAGAASVLTSAASASTSPGACSSGEALYVRVAPSNSNSSPSPPTSSRALPSITASAIRAVTSRTARMASSFEGIGQSMRSGL